MVTLMKVDSGRQAVWEHAKECGLDDDIKRIASFFDISDVSIIGNGRMTYLKEKPRKMIRVPAVPVRVDSKSIVNQTKEQKKRLR